VISLPTITLNSPATTAAFTDVSVSYDYLVTGRTYTVNWGDGASQPLVGDGSQQMMTHQYKKDGVYQITTLGSVNLANSAPTTVTIKSPPPTLNITGTGLTANLSVNGLQIDTQYTVDWGDNTTTVPAPNVAVQQLSHAYAAAGVYAVKLYGGAAVLSTASFTATIGQVAVSVTPDKPVIGAQVILNATGLAPSAEYELNWGDGTVENGITGQSVLNRTHGYASAQDFTVTIQSGGATLGTAVVAVQVPSPVLSPSVQGLTLTLQVNALVVGTAYTLDWGDGLTEPLNAGAPAATLTHAYARPGSYTVVVRPARGLPSSQTVTLVASPPRLSVQPASVETDQTVTAAMADLIRTLTYTLDWKDGPPVTFTAADVVATLTHSYAVPGTYQVDLTAPGTNPVSAPVTVRPAAPTLQLSASELNVTLVASRLYAGVTYSISWGGGVTESFQATGPVMTFTHAYAAPGVQTVSVTPNGGTPATATVALTLPTPTLSVTPAQGLTDTTFNATLGQLVPALNYTLNWGDGSTEPVTGAATFTRTHQYAAPGTFSVSVEYADSPPAQQTVTVRVPTPVLSATNTNLDATLRLSRLVRGGTYRVQWGDGQEQSLTAQTPETALTHTYAAPGTYTLTVTPALGDPGSVTLNVRYVTVAAPTLSVTPVSAVVYDSLRADFGGLVASLSYTLDWGDGQREVITGLSAGNRVHTYTTAGTYAVSLKAPESPAATVTATITQPVPALAVSSAALQAQATLTGLVGALTYRMDWGDGTPAVSVTGVPSQSLSHAYARPGDYRLTLSVPGGPPVTAALSVSVQAAILTPVANALSLTATVSGLQSALTYRLAWGDGSSTDITGKTADTLTHAYARPGVYTLELSTPGTASVTATVNLKANAVLLTVVAPELRAAASLSGLVGTLTYTVNWGDGQQDTLTGQTSANLVHLYQKTGQYTVTVTAPGTDPVTALLIVGLPPQEVITATPGIAAGTAPGTQEVRITGLLTGGTYLLDYGDGQTEPLFFTGQSGIWTHRYTRTGVYVLTLLLRSADGVNSVRAVGTVQAQQPLALSAVTVTFTREPSNTALNLSTLDSVPLQLSVVYSGSGSLTGNWVLDGQVGPAVTLDLPEGGGPATATYAVSTPRPGRHTLSFQITALTPRCAGNCPQPTLLAANTVSYTLDSPSTLSYGGFTVKLTSVTNLDLKAFTGTGTLRLVVAGVDLGSQNVTLTNLTVTRTISGATDAGYKVTGGSATVVDLNSLALRALSLGQAAVNLQALTLSPDGAALSGTVGLPGGAGTLNFADARLQDGGFLANLGGTGPGLKDLAIGTTGVSVAAASGVLDLSGTQNADALGAAYARSALGAPGPDWMGVVLTGATLSVGTPLVSGTPVTVTAPVAYTLGGYTTAFELSPTNLTLGGWTLHTGGLKIAISTSEIASA
jgi:PKD repeat protein